MPTDDALSEATRERIATAVGESLGVDQPLELVEEQPLPPGDDGTNEFIRLRALLGGDCTSG